jgi:hypothetical protein
MKVAEATPRWRSELDSYVEEALDLAKVTDADRRARTFEFAHGELNEWLAEVEGDDPLPDDFDPVSCFLACDVLHHIYG